MLINVITRTSNRPRAFARARESVLAQEFDGEVCHMVTTDDPNDKYVESDLILKVQPENVEFPPNLYVNEALALVETGWVVFLDDDNIFLRPDALQIIAEHATDVYSLLLFKVKLLGRDIPTYNWCKPPVEGDIDTHCFAFHAKNRALARFSERYAGDFDSVSRLYEYLEPVWIDKVLAGSQRADGALGVGLREDVA